MDTGSKMPISYRNVRNRGCNFTIESVLEARLYIGMRENWGYKKVKY